MLTEEKIEKIQSSIDKDARQGYKSEDNDFFGYKSHVAMTRERIVTALEVTSGEAPDGKFMTSLVEKSKRTGLEVKEVIGDKAYSGKDNLEYGKKNDIKIISRIHPIITNAIENKNDGFEFIKDADTFRCPMGTIAVRKKLISGKKYKDGYRNDKMMYTFDKETCLNCPKKETCLGKKKENRAKRYTIKLLSIAHKEQYDFEQTEYFNKTLREERYKIEAKNAETKLAHGLCKARTVGLSGVRVQSYLTHIVTNLKRIIKLMDSKKAIE